MIVQFYLNEQSTEQTGHCKPVHGEQWVPFHLKLHGMPFVLEDIAAGFVAVYIQVARYSLQPYDLQ